MVVLERGRERRRDEDGVVVRERERGALRVRGRQDVLARGGVADARRDGLGEEVLAGGHGLLRVRVGVLADLVQVEAVAVRARLAVEKVRAVLCGPVGRAQQLPVEPRAVDGRDARGGVGLARVRHVAAHRGARRRVVAVRRLHVHDELLDLAVLPKELGARQQVLRRLLARVQKLQRDVRHVHQAPLDHTDVRQLLAPRQLLCRDLSRCRRCFHRLCPRDCCAAAARCSICDPRSCR